MIDEGTTTYKINAALTIVVHDDSGSIMIVSGDKLAGVAKGVEFKKFIDEYLLKAKGV